MISAKHEFLLFARELSVDVADNEEGSREPDGGAAQDTAPQGPIKHLLTHQQGQLH